MVHALLHLSFPPASLCWHSSTVFGADGMKRAWKTTQRLVASATVSTVPPIVRLEDILTQQSFRYHWFMDKCGWHIAYAKISIVFVLLLCETLSNETESIRNLRQQRFSRPIQLCHQEYSILSWRGKKTLMLTVIAACGLSAQPTKPSSGGLQLNGTNAITCPSGKSYQTKVYDLINYLTTLIH